MRLYCSTIAAALSGRTNGRTNPGTFSCSARIFLCISTTSAVPFWSSGAGGIAIGLVRMTITHSKKSRQKRVKRARRARGEKRFSLKEHEQPVGEQLWLQEILQPTLFDVVRALQDEQPMGLEAPPKLDSWGVTFLIMMILQFFSGSYARTLDKPYRLPGAPLGQNVEPDIKNQGDEPSGYPAYSTNDLYNLFTAMRAGEGEPFQGNEAKQSKNRIEPRQKRVKRSGHVGRHHHRRDHPRRGYHRRRGRRHQRRDIEETFDPSQNAAAYPEEKLSSWMRDLINSVASPSALLGPSLRKIGFDPDEMIDVRIARPGTHIRPTQQKVTAAEFTLYLTTSRTPGYSMRPVTDRGKELKSAIEERGRYGEKNFLVKEALDPNRDKFRHEGLDAIADKFKKEGIFLEWGATLFHVTAIETPTPMSDMFSGTLGTIVKMAGPERKYFAIVPHHPDLVIRLPDPASKTEWNDWMISKGKYLFFSDPSALPEGVKFYLKREDPSNIAHPSDTLRGAVVHTLKPIINGTMQHMTDLVANETPAEQALNRLLGFIPFYDVMKSIKDREYKKALMFLSLELIPYVGKGAKVFVKTVFVGGAARAAANQLAKRTDRIYSWSKNLFGSNVVDRTIDGESESE